jgi:hypothetical protein
VHFPDSFYSGLQFMLVASFLSHCLWVTKCCRFVDYL